MGMQTQCPYCATMFIIPVVDPQTLQAAYAQQYGVQYPQQSQQAEPEQQSYLPQELQDIYDPTTAQPGLRDFLDQVAAGEVAAESQAAAEQPAAAEGIDIHAPAVETGEPPESSFLHIPCPNGHELETPPDMLGQEVLCPHCNAQFRLRHQDSREYLAKQEQLDLERGKFWFNWAVAAAVLIGGGLVVLLLAAMAK